MTLLFGPQISARSIGGAVTVNGVLFHVNKCDEPSMRAGGAAMSTLQQTTRLPALWQMESERIVLT